MQKSTSKRRLEQEDVADEDVADQVVVVAEAVPDEKLETVPFHTVVISNFGDKDSRSTDHVPMRLSLAICNEVGHVL